MATTSFSLRFYSQTGPTGVLSPIVEAVQNAQGYEYDPASSGYVNIASGTSVFFNNDLYNLVYKFEGWEEIHAWATEGSSLVGSGTATYHTYAN